MTTRDEELQKALNALKISKMKFLLLAMAHGLNEDTKFMTIPYGSRWFKLVIPPDGEPVLNREAYNRYNNPEERGYDHIQPTLKFKTVIVDLQEFFDMHIAYCPEANIILYWNHDKKAERQWTTTS